MFLPSHRFTIVKLVCFSILFVGAVSAITWGAMNNYSLTRSKTPVSAITTVVAQGGNQADRIDAEVITLTQMGFWPQEITRPKGRVLIAVETRLEGDQPITLGLYDEKRNRLKEYKGRGGKKGWTNIVNLNPGQYVISVAENPNWICRLTITPQ